MLVMKQSETVIILDSAIGINIGSDGHLLVAFLFLPTTPFVRKCTNDETVAVS